MGPADLAAGMIERLPGLQLPVLGTPTDRGGLLWRAVLAAGRLSVCQCGAWICSWQRASIASFVCTLPAARSSGTARLGLGKWPPDDAKSLFTRSDRICAGLGAY